MVTAFIVTLKTELQRQIRDELIKKGLASDDVEKAMNSRLCDLENTIDVYRFINNEFIY